MPSVQLKLVDDQTRYIPTRNFFNCAARCYGTLGRGREDHLNGINVGRPPLRYAASLKTRSGLTPIPFFLIRESSRSRRPTLKLGREQKWAAHRRWMWSAAMEEPPTDYPWRGLSYDNECDSHSHDDQRICASDRDGEINVGHDFLWLELGLAVEHRTTPVQLSILHTPSGRSEFVPRKVTWAAADPAMIARDWFGKRSLADWPSGVVRSSAFHREAWRLLASRLQIARATSAQRFSSWPWCSPLTSGGSTTLSVTDRCRYGAVMRSPCRKTLLIDEQYCSFA